MVGQIPLNEKVEKIFILVIWHTHRLVYFWPIELSVLKMFSIYFSCFQNK